MTKEISAQNFQKLFNDEAVRLRKEQLESGAWQSLSSMVMTALENVTYDILRNYPHGSKLVITYDEQFSAMIDLIADVMARKPYEFSAKLVE